MHERSIAEAEERLREIEQRTKAAEERAAEAQRLEQLRSGELERQQRLEEVQRSIAAAEERAREAERRAAEAEQAVLRSVQGEAPSQINAEMPLAAPPVASPSPPPQPSAGVIRPSGRGWAPS